MTDISKVGGQIGITVGNGDTAYYPQNDVQHRFNGNVLVLKIKEDGSTTIKEIPLADLKVGGQAPADKADALVKLAAVFPNPGSVVDTLTIRNAVDHNRKAFVNVLQNGDLQVEETMQNVIVTNIILSAELVEDSDLQPGTYSYKFTNYNGDLGFETEGSDATSNIVVESADYKIFVNNIPFSPLGASKKVYRKQDNGDWVYLFIIAGDLDSFEDTVQDPTGDLPPTINNYITVAAIIPQGSRPAKRYDIMFTQEGTNDPIVIIGENSLDFGITFIRTAAGEFNLNSPSGAFISPSFKECFYHLTMGLLPIENVMFAIQANVEYVSANDIVIRNYKIISTGVELTDGVSTRACLSVWVYQD